MSTVKGYGWTRSAAVPQRPAMMYPSLGENTNQFWNRVCYCKGIIPNVRTVVPATALSLSALSTLREITPGFFRLRRNAATPPLATTRFHSGTVHRL